MNIQEDLNNDELGEKGESRFKEICADAKLICNKSDRDRTGWDFIVEFPFKNQEHSTFDTRATPISCHIQVKTLIESRNSFAMRLTSAHRLAKEPKPAFVYVFKVNKQLQITESYLVHIFGDRLAAILKRLRIEESKKTPENKLNKKYITMSLKEMERIEQTGGALRTSLESIVSDNMHAYITTKEAQLEKLGFELRPYEGKMSLQIPNLDEMVDVFLGLKNGIPVSNLNVTQERFGIKLPQSQLSSAQAIISIKPHPIAKCTISFRRDDLTAPAIFQGEIFVPAIPSLPSDKFKVLIKSPLFSIIIQQNGPNEITYTLTYNDINQKNDLETWSQFWRMIQALASGKGEIQILPEQTQMEKITLPILPSSAGGSIDNCESWLSLCEQASTLFNKAGMSSKLKLNLDDLEIASKPIRFASLLLNGETAGISFISEKPNGIDKLSDAVIILSDLVKFGDEAIAYYGVMTAHPIITAEQIEWCPTKFEPRSIQVINITRDGYEAFVETAKVKENTPNVLLVTNDFH